MGGGLVQQVSSNPVKGGTDIWAQHTKQPTKYARTAFEIIASDITPAEQSDPNTIRHVVFCHGDLMGDVWYEITFANSIPVDVYSIIENITFEIGGKTIESYTGQALKMLSLFDKKATPHAVSNTVSFPIKLCTSDHMESYLPLLCLASHAVVINIKLSKSIKPEDVIKQRMYITYVQLDTEERRNLNVGVPYKYPVTLKTSSKHQLVVQDPKQSKQIRIQRNMELRDIIFLVEPKTHTTSDQLIRASLTCTNGGKHYDVYAKTSPIMFQHMIPQQYYGVEKNSHPIYFMPFDHLPLSAISASNLNTSQYDWTLELCLQPGAYNVHVMTRTNNIIGITSGMGSLQNPYSPPPPPASVSYDDMLKLYRIHSKSSISSEIINECTKRGWKIYVDGHSQIYGLLDAPKDATDQVNEVFAC